MQIARIYESTPFKAIMWERRLNKLSNIKRKAKVEHMAQSWLFKTTISSLSSYKASPSAPSLSVPYQEPYKMKSS